MIVLTYVTNPDSFAFIAFLVFKLLTRKEFVLKSRLHFKRIINFTGV